MLLYSCRWTWWVAVGSMASSRQMLAAAAAEQTGMLLASFEVRSGRQHGSQSGRPQVQQVRKVHLVDYLKSFCMCSYLPLRSPKLDRSFLDYN